MHLHFPQLETILASLIPPQNFSVDELARTEIDMVVTLLAAWYPTLRTGMEGVHLDPNYYANEVKLKDEPQTEQIDWTLVAKHEQKIVGLYSLKYIARARQIAGRLIAIDPAFRRSGLSDFGCQILIAIAHHLGAAMIWGTATLSHTVSQHTLAKHGFRLCGIFPAYDLDAFESGGSKFVCEAIYCHVLAKPEEMIKPDSANMTHAVQSLWNFLSLDSLFKS